MNDNIWSTYVNNDITCATKWKKNIKISRWWENTRVGKKVNLEDSFSLGQIISKAKLPEKMKYKFPCK